MKAEDFVLGFRVDGPPSGARVLGVAEDIFGAALESEEGTGEAYGSMYAFPRGLLEHVRATGGTAGYGGPVWARRLTLDFDGHGGEPLEDGLGKAKRALVWLEGTAAADLRFVLCFFSGAKGVHVVLPLAGVAPGPEDNFHGVAKAFARLLGEESGGMPDGAVYDRQRLIRLPNSRHGKTGLFKRALPAEKLLGLSAGRVRELARRPEAVELLEPEPGAAWCCWELPHLWERARGVAAQGAARVPTGPRERLNPETADFVRWGAAGGTRAVRCFAASANLGEVGCSLEACVALLLEPSLDCGLPESEARRQIELGFAHGAGRTSV